MGFVKNTLYKVASPAMLGNFRKQLIFPYYHLIENGSLPHIRHLYPYKNREQFKKDLDFLTTNYSIIDPRDLMAGRRPENGFLLTFDDGLLEVYTEIYPILKERNIPAIFFINPDYVGTGKILYKHAASILFSELKKADANKLSQITSVLGLSNPKEIAAGIRHISYANRHLLHEIAAILEVDINLYMQARPIYMNKDQIREMIDAGFYFGGHTYTHPPLDQISFDEQKQEIISSIDWLKKNFGIEYSMFAFPFSDKSASKKLLSELFDYDKDILIFGNSGLKQDIDPRIIQRFSFENPNRETAKLVVTENLYKVFNKLIGKYKIKR